MGSNFHYSIDLNEDQNHQEQTFFYPFGPSSSILHNQQHHHHHHHQVPSNSSSPISSLSSYLPFLINSQEDQHVAYNNTYHDDHLHLSQPLKDKLFNGGSSSSYDHTVPKKERRLKVTIKKKYHHEGQTDFLHQNSTKPNAGSDKWLMSPKMRLIKKTIINNKQPIDHTYSSNNNHKEDHYPLVHKTTFSEDHDEELKKVSSRTTSTTENRYNTINENGYGNNNGVIRVCSDCNTTKTPLWRSGPRGPKTKKGEAGRNGCSRSRWRRPRGGGCAASTFTREKEVTKQEKTI
ncbi:GATA transcription factor 21 [Hirschfeldia incana]|nr:GATA transcription factor 21 [Hirschfeldia incana]